MKAVVTHNKPLLHRWLEGVWYENARGKNLLRPLASLYCFLSQRRREKLEKKQQPSSLPVIVVGNITAGGTGKTPLVIYLVRLLKKSGYKPAIITRGYGGNSTQKPQLVTSEGNPVQLGDEPVLMAIRTRVPVIAGADRLADIDFINNQTDCDIIISDDGLQHYRMPRTMEIAVIDAQRRFGNGLCIPAGPLREKPSRLAECDFIVSNGTAMSKQTTLGKGKILPGEFTMQIQGSTLHNLFTDESQSLADWSGKTVNVLTGIGNPHRFFDTLKKSGLNIATKHIFPDHYQFQQADLVIDDIPCIMTEKDAVKCRLLSSDSVPLENLWYLPVEAKLDDDFDYRFLKKL